MTGWPLSQQKCLKRGIVLIQDAGRSEHQSDLLFKGPLSSSGGSISGCSLHRLVGHDTGGKLLLGPLKAGARGAVQRMDLMRMWRLEVKRGHLSNACGWSYLFEHDQGHGGQRGEENGNNDHDDAHGGAFIQAGHSRDPPTTDEKRTFNTADG